MKIQLIAPTILDEKKRPIKYKKALLPPLALALLDGLTPSHHDVKIVNDLVEEPDYSSSYDMVGITGLTSQVLRSYQIADRFRSMGVPVILGGIHSTVMPHEAKEHADSVFIGEMGKSWTQILEDVQNHRLQEFYKEESLPDLCDSILPRWDHMNMKIYFKPPGQKMPNIPVYTTRGCVFDCKFCSVSKYFGKTYRTKPVPMVMEEINHSGGTHFFFLDDNIGVQPHYTEELFKTLIPRKIKWYSQVSTTILKSPGLIELAGKSGCFALLVGLESLDPHLLHSMKKSFNQPDEYAELVARIRKAGIIPVPSIIIGTESDPLEQMNYSIDFLLKNKIGAVVFTILTPFPGTEVYEEFEKSNRILTKDWTQYDLTHLVFQPGHCSIDEFHKIYWEGHRRYFSFKNMMKRLYYITSNSRHRFTSFIEAASYMWYSKRQLAHNSIPIGSGVYRVPNKD